MLLDEVEQLTREAEVITGKRKMLAGEAARNYRIATDYVERAEKAEALLREAIARCRHHAEFCKYEAEHGGSKDLFERAKGAAHLAQVIEDMARAHFAELTAEERSAEKGDPA